MIFTVVECMAMVLHAFFIELYLLYAPKLRKASVYAFWNNWDILSNNTLLLGSFRVRTYNFPVTDHVPPWYKVQKLPACKRAHLFTFSICPRRVLIYSRIEFTLYFVIVNLMMKTMMGRISIHSSSTPFE